MLYSFSKFKISVIINQITKRFRVLSYIVTSTKYSTAFKGKAISQALPPFSSGSPVAICIARFATQIINPDI